MAIGYVQNRLLAIAAPSAMAFTSAKTAFG